ncbi:DUF928 domain-containing protein [Anabaena lutea]|uniref:DUF928 domain-containing protein n=1 Tax=Anabaena lutea FACHB-196 TaxID=2692881 RepID=A0ABR8FCD4_9NOST|nr:DUF928 domain-containing protein [Anabaena lutea]MBD2567882.1 DUF928 domain-containing protein [Anabaena lutea FACHB-196]
MKWLQASFSLLIVSLTAYTTTASVLAQSRPAQKTWQISQKFKPQRGKDPNPPTVGAATRSASCLQGKQEITPLIPADKLGLTLNGHPTFYWSVSTLPVKTAQFTIETNGDEQPFYETDIKLPEQPGIFSFTLPKNTPELPVGKTYRWYLTIICDGEDSSNNPFVEGLVERIQAELPLSDTLAKATARQLPTIYAEYGIWHEALTTSVELRCTQPNDLVVKLNWRQLLTSVGLNDILSEPLLDSCQTKNE